MLARLIGISVFSILLSACGSDPIDIVKESHLANDETLTIDQAFSNRKICDDITWEQYEDDRERTIVNYTCDIDSGDYFDELREKQIQSTIASFNNVDKRTKQEIDHINQSIKIRNSTLAKIQDMNQAERDIWKTSKAIGNISTYGVDGIVPKGETLRSYAPKIKSQFKLIKEKYSLSGCINYAYMPTGDLVAACTKLLSGQIKSKKNSLKSQQDFAARTEAAHNDRLDFLKNKTTEKIAEYAQWSFKEVDGEQYPTLISIGYNKTLADGEVKSRSYRNSKRAISVIYNNSIDELVSFMKINRIIP